MTEERCPNCGAPLRPGSTECDSCRKALPVQGGAPARIFPAMENSDWLVIVWLLLMVAALGWRFLH